MLRGSGRQRRALPAVDPRDAVELSQPAADRRVDHVEQVHRCAPGSSSSQYGSAAAIAADQRPEAGRGRPRVHPDHPVRAPAQPGHRRGQIAPAGRCPSRPSDDHATAPRSASPCRERSSARTLRRDPGAAEPVGHPRGGQLARPVGRAVREHRGEPGQPGGEREHLGVRRAPRPPASGAGTRWSGGCIDWLTSHSMTHPPGSGDRAGADELGSAPSRCAGPGPWWRAARSGPRPGAPGVPPGPAGRPVRQGGLEPVPRARASSAVVQLARTGTSASASSALGSRCGTAGRAVAVSAAVAPPAAAWPRAARRRPARRPGRRWSGTGPWVSPSDGAARARGGPCGSSRSPASSKTAAKTASKTARSACRRDQAGAGGPVQPAPGVERRRPPAPGRSPRPRSARPARRRARSRAAKATANAARSTPRSRRAGARSSAGSASRTRRSSSEAMQQLAVVGGLGMVPRVRTHVVADQLADAQRGQRGHPVDRLGHPGRPCPGRAGGPRRRTRWPR